MVSHETVSKRIMPVAEDEVHDEKLHQDFMEEMRKLRDSLPSSNQSLNSRAGPSTSQSELSHISSNFSTPPQRAHTSMPRAQKPRSNSLDMGGVPTEQPAVRTLSGAIEGTARPVSRSSRKLLVKGAHGSPFHETPANQATESDTRFKPRAPSTRPHETLANTSARLFRGRPLVMPSSDGQMAEGSTNPVPRRKIGDVRE